MTPRTAIVTDEPGWHGARLSEALAARGRQAQYVSLRACGFDLDAPATCGLRVAGFEHALPEGVFVRGVPGGTLEEIVLYLDVLHALRELGIAVYNDGRGIERSVDKAMTSFLLRRAGVPTPATWVTSDAEQARTLKMRAHAAGHEVVCKPLFGSQGQGLQRLAAGDPLPQSELYGGVYYLQRFIDTGAGDWHDWRVFVIAGRVVAAMRRQGRTWISNVAHGARCQPAVIDERLRDLALQAAATVNLYYAGVDIMRDRQGQCWVVEVNSIPAWRGLQGACNLDMAPLLVEDFLACCRRQGGVEVAG